MIRAIHIIMAFAAGILLGSDILPEAHSRRSSFRLIGLTVLGAVFIFVTSRFI